MKTDSVTNKSSVKKSIAFIAVYQVIMWVLPLITTPYISRILEADGVGVCSYTGSVQYYFSMFAVLGTASYGSREISMHRDNRVTISQRFWEIELLNLITTTVCLVVWTGLVLYSSEYKLYFCILTVSLFTSLLDVNWFFSGLERFKLTAIQGTIFNIISVISVFLVLKHKSDLPLYMFVTCGISLLGSVSMWVHLPRYINRVPLRSLHVMHHLKETIIYFVPTFATSIYTVLDKTLIGLITNNRYQNGYYEQAHNAIGLAKQITYSAINTVLGARIAYMFAEKKMDEVKRLINKSMDFIMMIGFGAMFGIAAVASHFVPLFFGEGYDMSVTLIYVMCPLVIIISVSNCLGNQYYSPVGLRARSAKYIVTGSVFNLILNLILIPFFESIGAAVGSIIAELVISALYMKNCDGIVSFKSLFSYSYKRLAAGVVMFLCVLYIGEICHMGRLLVLIIQVVSGVSIYMLTLLAMRDRTVIRILGSIGKRLHKVDA